MFKRARHFMHISCEEAAVIISESQDTPVGFSKRLQVLLHNAFCKACRAYMRFVRGIGALARRELQAPLTEKNRQNLRARIHLHEHG